MSGELNLPPHLLHALEALSVLPSDTAVLRNPDGKWMVKSIPMTEQPLNQLGPFGVMKAKVFLSFTSKSEPGMYRVDFRLKLSVLDEWVLPTGCHGPITEIPWSDEDKAMIGVRKEATRFCWCYPPALMETLSADRKLILEKYIKAKDPEFTFLAFGGFVYFTENPQGGLQIVRVSALAQGGTGIAFDSPLSWRPQFTPYLFRQGRFQGVTIQAFKDMGLNQYCYINPNEELISENGDETWTPCPNGGFVYLYNMNSEPHACDRYFPQSPTFLDSSFVTPSSPSTPLGTSPGSIPFSMVMRNTLAAKGPAQSPQLLAASSSQVAASSSREGSIAKSGTTVPYAIPERVPNPNNAGFGVCVICLENHVNVLIIPCKHVCVCSQCMSFVHDTCPLCRAEIRDKWNVFL